MSRRTVINGRYELEDLPIARGGMGEIWAGRDIRLDREVVVKLIRFPDGVPDQDFVRRFVRESRVMARLAHPGVPAVYDVGAHENRPYLVMQRIRGISVKDLIAEQGRLPVGWATGIAAQICAVLTVAHQASLVHRDLKPSNVMLDTEGAVKVLDFGLATGPNLADFSKVTRTGEPIGTPAYMAPEQVMAAISTPQTDLYALGCTLHEALTGQALFTGSTSYSLMNQQVSQRPTPVRVVRPDVPSELEELVLAMLEKRPEDRPAGADLVYQRLLPFVVALGPLTGAIDPPSKLGPSRMYARVVGRVFADVQGVADHEPAGPVPSSDPAAAVPRASSGLGSEPDQSGRTHRLDRNDLNKARLDAADLTRQSRFSQAADLLASTIDRARTAFGDADNEVMSLRLDLANVHFEGGDYRSAAPEYRRLAARLTARDGADNELVLQCRMKEATCRALVGETRQALSQLSDLLTDESRIFGSDDARTIELRRRIALLQLGSGERASAVATLKRLHSDLVRVHGAKHASLTEVQQLLNQIEQTQQGS